MTAIAPEADGTGRVLDLAEQAVTVITVTYNSADDVGTMLESLSRAGLASDAEVLVVDNASTDATARVVSGLGRGTLLACGENLGYSGAINRGREARRAPGPVLVVNPDLHLESGALGQLCAASRDNVGIVVPKIVDEHGRLFHSLRREPTVRRALGDAFFGRRWPRRPAWLSEVVWDDREYERAQDIDWATGAAMLVSRACEAAVGAWDEHRFFLYSEETDYARRARDAGLRVHYVPTAVVMHRGSGSGASAELVALLVVNRVRYFEKYHGRAHATAFRVVAAFHELLRFWDFNHRVALCFVTRRRTWQSLPGNRL